MQAQTPQEQDELDSRRSGSASCWIAHPAPLLSAEGGREEEGFQSDFHEKPCFLTSFTGKGSPPTPICGLKDRA